MSEKDKTPAVGPRAQEKRRQILQSALEEFAAHGYSAASMDRISEKAGVSKATVYSYFGDKGNLYGELIEKKLKEACFLDLQRLQSPGTVSTVQHIEQLIELLGFQAQNPESETMMNFMRMTIAESGRFPEMAQMFVERVEKPINQALAKYLRACGVSEEDSSAMSWIVSGTFIYHIIIHRVLSGGEIMPMELSELTGLLGRLISSYIEKYS
ncbi:MAG: TetR/AcrR family transcriptional regulator [Candidatus Obscuribacterales bacterium]|nr:TetR/AcrR family transcriptional regulator [Candidatus Obscuribacterales bacterium]